MDQEDAVQVLVTWSVAIMSTSYHSAGVLVWNANKLMIMMIFVHL